MTWRLDGDCATLDLHALRMVVNASEPASGAASLHCGGQPINGRLWSWSPVDAPRLKLADAYVRGRDFVAEYQPTDGWPYHSQAYWRVESDESDVVTSLSLILSVRTHLLDTNPVYEAGSQFAECSTSLLTDPDEADSATAVLHSATDGSFSIVETVQPGDRLPEGGGRTD